MAMVALDSLATVSLQIDTIQGETIQRTEVLHLAGRVDSLDHIEIAAPRIAPFTRQGDLATLAERRQARCAAELAGDPLKLDRVSRQDVRGARVLTLVANIRRQLVGIAECRETRLAAQVMGGTCDVELTYDRRHPLADRTRRRALATRRAVTTTVRLHLGVLGTRLFIHDDECRRLGQSIFTTAGTRLHFLLEFTHTSLPIVKSSIQTNTVSVSDNNALQAK